MKNAFLTRKKSFTSTILYFICNIKNPNNKITSQTPPPQKNPQPTPPPSKTNEQKTPKQNKMKKKPKKQTNQKTLQKSKPKFKQLLQNQRNKTKQKKSLTGKSWVGCLTYFTSITPSWLFGDGVTRPCHSVKHPDITVRVLNTESIVLKNTSNILTQASKEPPQINCSWRW